MTTWIIISACLYLIGMLPTLTCYLDDDGKPELTTGRFALIILFWPLAFLAILALFLWDFVSGGIVKAYKGFFVIVIAALCSCNDGGSPDPDLVSDSSKGGEMVIGETKLLDTILTVKKDTLTSKSSFLIWIDTITIGGTTTIFDNDGNIIASIKAHSSCRNK